MATRRRQAGRSSRKTSPAAALAGYIAPTLQAALDDWERIAPELELLARDVEHETVTVRAVPRNARRIRRCRAPIQWADGSAYINHVELVRQARGAKVPDSFYHDPADVSGRDSDTFLPPRQTRSHWAIRHGAATWRARFAAITDDVPMGVSGGRRRSAHQAADAGQRCEPSGPDPGGIWKRGFGFFQSKTRQCLFAGRRHA